MASDYKTENGIDYSIVRRRDPSITEGAWYWKGSDGSILELTDEEVADRDTSRSITDRD